MQKNVASQKVIVYSYNKMTGAALTGDSGNFSKLVSKDGGGVSSGGGTFSEIAVGYYAYAPTQAETNCDLFLLLTTSSTANAIVDEVVIYTRVDDSIETKLDTVDGIVDSILVDTGTTLDGKIDVIDGIADSILVDTGTTLNDKIDVIDGIVDAILVDTGTTLPAQLLAIFSDTDALASATFADGKSLAQAIQIIAAAVAGRVSGAGTGTETFLGMDEATPRVVVTVDSDGNRSDISYG